MVFFRKSLDIGILQIRMNYDVGSGTGTGSTYWSFPNPHQLLSNQQIQVITVTALYARMLQVQASSRAGLIERVAPFFNSLLKQDLSPNLESWEEIIGNEFYTIHPFSKSQFSQMNSAKLYKVSLQISPKEALIYQVNTAFGLERVLIPASVCLSICELMPLLEDENKVFFGMLLAYTTKALIQMGTYRIGDDHKALLFALSTLSNAGG